MHNIFLLILIVEAHIFNNEYASVSELYVPVTLKREGGRAKKIHYTQICVKVDSILLQQKISTKSITCPPLIASTAFHKSQLMMSAFR